MKRKAVTMKDIADRLGVSKNAVSLALAGKAGVSTELAEKVMAEAKRMGYFSAPSDNTCIQVLVPSYIRDDGSFYSDIFWSIEHESRKAGITTITSSVNADMQEKGIIPLIPAGLHAVGCIVVGIINASYIEKLSQTGIKVVSVDIRPPLQISSVSTDNIYAGKSAAEYLIVNGHKDIGFIGPVYAAQSVYERLCGFRQALTQSRLELREEYCIFGSSRKFELLDDEDILRGYFTSLRSMPTAFFCAGDMIAYSLYKILKKAGYRIPEDISVIGCDDLKMSEMIQPPLTTMHINRKAMGVYAVNQLLMERNSAPHHVLLPASIVERSSVQKI